MLTSFDDYPIHQASVPIAETATSDVNHYDRYFFNGYRRDGSVYFALAMGLYPNRHVADAAFSVVRDGALQVNVHASRRAPTDRRDANEVGPIRVEIVEPLHRLRLIVDAPDHGLRAEITFTSRSPAIQEPHFHQRTGVRVLFDYTRLTQFGTWSGWIELDGERIELTDDDAWGSRDRSWGIRPVGERAALGAPTAAPQFYWLWAPVNFDGFSTHFDVNEHGDGRRWHETGFLAPSRGRARGDAGGRLPAGVATGHTLGCVVRDRSDRLGRRHHDRATRADVPLPDAGHRLRAPRVVTRRVEGRARRRR